jgi:hypothetical protein
MAKNNSSMSKLIPLLLLLLISTVSISQVKTGSTKIDPTGTYALVTHDTDKNYGGDIYVKLIQKSKIAIALYIGMGGIAENNGTLNNTLQFKNNHAIFKTKWDSTCTIIFKFTSKGIWVIQKAADPNFECGFGHAVYADGYYRKVSSKRPSDKDLKL